ncbi:hypothetical protein J6590_097932 [Homalodisca vitripennis]|nr:hypothetical protein J6590_097932 [Homalodisca vitripennis]
MAYDPPKARLTWQFSGTQTLSVTHIRVNQWMSRRGILQLPDTVVEGWIDESNLLVRMTVDILPVHEGVLYTFTAKAVIERPPCHPR